MLNSMAPLQSCAQVLSRAFNGYNITLEDREILLRTLGSNNIAFVRVSLRCGKALLQTRNLLIPGPNNITVCALGNTLAARAIQARKPITFAVPAAKMSSIGNSRHSTSPTAAPSQLTVVCAPALVFPRKEKASVIAPVGVGALVLGFKGPFGIASHMRSRVLALAESLAPLLATVALPQVEYLAPLLHMNMNDGIIQDAEIDLPQEAVQLRAEVQDQNRQQPVATGRLGSITEEASEEPSNVHNNDNSSSTAPMCLACEAGSGRFHRSHNREGHGIFPVPLLNESAVQYSSSLQSSCFGAQAAVTSGR